MIWLAANGNALKTWKQKRCNKNQRNHLRVLEVIIFDAKLSITESLHWNNRGSFWPSLVSLKDLRILSHSSQPCIQKWLGFVVEVITIRSTAFWGSVTLIVPPNVAVEQDGSAILGGFGEAGGVWSNHNTVGASQSAAPVTLRVVGTALMGRVNAVVNHRAKPAVLLSAEEVERILREVPPEPSTTVQDFMAHAMQAGIEKICFLDCFLGM